MMAAMSIKPCAIVRSWLQLTALVLLSACATVPSRVTLSESQLSDQLSARLSTPQRWLDVVGLKLANPQVVADAEHDRLRARVDLQTSRQGATERLEARIVLSAGVRFEAADHSLRLRDVMIETGSPAERGSRPIHVDRFAAAMLGPMLEDVVLYRLPQHQVQRLRDEALTVVDLRVTAAGLQFTLGPKP